MSRNTPKQGNETPTEEELRTTMSETLEQHFKKQLIAQCEMLTTQIKLLPVSMAMNGNLHFALQDVVGKLYDMAKCESHFDIEVPF